MLRAFWRGERLGGKAMKVVFDRRGLRERVGIEDKYCALALEMSGPQYVFPCIDELIILENSNIKLGRN